MRKSKSTQADQSKLLPGDEHYVGRGHPPKHSQIKKGEVRNKWGRGGKPRPAQVRSGFDEHMAKLLSEPMVAKDGQSYEQASVIFSALLKQASAGNLKAIELYINLRDKYVSTSVDLANDNLEEDDEAVLARYAAEVLAGSEGPRQLNATRPVQEVEEADDV